MIRERAEPEADRSTGRRRSRNPRDERERKRTGSTAADLQRRVGNRAVQRLAGEADRQPATDGKSTLAVSDPDGPAEREAERVAEAVVRSGESPAEPGPTAGPAVQTKPRSSGEGPQPSRAGPQPSGERSTDDGAREAADPTGDGARAAVSDVVDSPGRPLESSVRASMEERFGASFGGVRVHTGPEAVESARAVDARAYTVGEDVAFDHGEYAPETPAGRRLLAHELAHVLQQRGAAPRLQRQDATAAGGSEDAQFTPYHPEVDVRLDEPSGRMYVTVDGTTVVEAQAPEGRPYGVEVQSHWDAESGSFKLEVVATEGTDVAFTPGGPEALGEMFSDVELRTTTVAKPIEVRAHPEEIPFEREPGGSERAQPPARPEPAAESGGGWSSVSEWVHGALDVAGFVPGVGEIADGVNALIYTAEGRYAEAAISAAAMIPVVGDLGKGGKWAAKVGGEIVETGATRTGREFAERGIRETGEELPEGTQRVVGRRRAIVEGAHDVGVKYGREAAEKMGLKDANWVNPFEFSGPYGQGFDDVMTDASGNLWILEYKGGSATLTGNQMSRRWVKSRIRRYRQKGGELGKFWADKLEAALKEGRLKGAAFQTPLEGGVPQGTRKLGEWSY